MVGKQRKLWLGSPAVGPGDGRQAGWEVIPRDCWEGPGIIQMLSVWRANSNSPMISQQLGLWFLTVIIR